MPHITKKQFFAHGWRKGDKIRDTKFNRVSEINSVHFYPALMVGYKVRGKGDDTISSSLYYKDIAAIIPATPKRREK
jgi:hypothetical protein